MMKVGIFTDNDFEKVNGVTTTLRSAIENSPADIRLRVYTRDWSGVDTASYLAVKAPGIGIPYYTDMKIYLPPVRRLLRQAAADRLDLIHLTTPGPVGLTGMWVAARLAIPMVGSFHTNLSEYAAQLSGSRWLGRITQEYLRWPYGQCSRILAPSQSTRQLLVAGGMEQARIRVWERGVSTSRFDPARRSETLRRRWGVSDNKPAVLYVGRISREKGLDDLHAVQRSLAARGIDHRFVFVGDGPMRRDLQPAFPDAVFTGTVSNDEVAVAMASSDVFVFPSRTDTAGNVVLEAQASGLPVLVSDEGGPQENIVPGVTGVVCGSTRELCRQVMELCVRAARRRRMAVAAREYALTRRWESSLAPLYQAYREVAASSSTSTAAAPVASGVAAA